MALAVNYRIRDERVRQAFGAFLRIANDPTPIMRGIATIGENSTRERFATQRGPDGERWPASQRVRRGGGRTLTWRGHLGDSISSRYSRESSEWGSNRVYDRAQQFGGVIVPKRARYLAVPMTPAARLTGPRQFETRLVAVRTDKGLFLLDPESRTAHYKLVRRIELPARPYLGISSADELDVLDLIEDRIGGVLHAR